MSDGILQEGRRQPSERGLTPSDLHVVFGNVQFKHQVLRGGVGSKLTVDSSGQLHEVEVVLLHLRGLGAEQTAVALA